MPKFPFIIVEFFDGSERVIAGAIDLHVAQAIWRRLEDEAPQYTRYVILHERQESTVAYEDRECESSMNHSCTNFGRNGIVNSANNGSPYRPIPTICLDAEPVEVHGSTCRST